MNVEAEPVAAVTCPACGESNRAGATFCRECGHRLGELVPVQAPAPAVESTGADDGAGDLVTVVAPVPPGGPAPDWRAVAITILRGTMAAAVVAWRWLIARPVRWLLALAVVVILVLASAAYVLEQAVYPPDQPVRALFAALAAHNGNDAGTLAGCSDSPLCTSAALATGYQAPTDVRIGSISYGAPSDLTRRPNKTAAYVEVSYQLPGQVGRQSATVEVQRTDHGYARPWSIYNGAYGWLDVVSPVDKHARVGGAIVPTVAEHQATTGLAGSLAAGGGNIEALPGVYTVAGDEDDPLFTATGTDAVVRAETGRNLAQAEVTLDVQIRPSVLPAVQRQVDASLDQCAASVDDVLHIGCPFDDPAGQIAYHVADDVTWKITSYPTVKLSIATDPAAAGGPIVVSTVTPGTARASWPASQGEAAGGYSAGVEASGVVTAGTDGQPVYTR